MRAKLFVASMLFCLTAQPTWADGAPAPVPVDAKALADLSSRQRAALTAAVGTPRCAADAQCKAQAVGHRACGGPESYIVYSTLNAKPAQVQKLAEEHTATRKLQSEASGMMSTCVMLMEPAVRCNAQTRLCEAVKDDNMAR